MDTNKIKSVVFDQLQNLSDVEALKVENHIYGCYMIIQELAEKSCLLSHTVLTKESHPAYHFDVDRQFSQIGIRYGFLMDSQLLFDSYLPAYKQLWLEFFNDISLTHDMEMVDAMEESINDCLMEKRPADRSFFFSAAQQGYLPQEDVDKVIDLLHPTLSYRALPVIDTPPLSTASTASTSSTERSLTTRRFHVTRRRVHTQALHKSLEKSYKKHLSKTRRVHFKI